MLANSSIEGWTTTRPEFKKDPTELLGLLTRQLEFSLRSCRLPKRHFAYNSLLSCFSELEAEVFLGF